MGRIIVEQIVSADGYAEDGDGGIGFFESTAALADPEMEAEQLRMLAPVGAIVLGRKTYRMFEAYWPDMSAEVERVAAPINALPKFVVSSTLASAPWGTQGASAEVLHGDGVASLRALRERIEGDLVVWGSLDLADVLLRAGEVDLLRLRVLPVLLGAGRRFTPAGLGLRRMQLETARPFPSGATLLAYRLR